VTAKKYCYNKFTNNYKEYTNREELHSPHTSIDWTETNSTHSSCTCSHKSSNRSNSCASSS